MKYCTILAARPHTTHARRGAWRGSVRHVTGQCGLTGTLLSIKRRSIEREVIATNTKKGAAISASDGLTTAVSSIWSTRWITGRAMRTASSSITVASAEPREIE